MHAVPRDLERLMTNKEAADKCICEGDFDGEQTSRSNPKAVCPVHDDCEWCGYFKASTIISDEKLCPACETISLRARVKDLEHSLRQLRNEVSGFISWKKGGLIELIGNTNYTVLESKIFLADEVLKDTGEHSQKQNPPA